MRALVRRSSLKVVALAVAAVGNLLLAPFSLVLLWYGAFYASSGFSPAAGWGGGDPRDLQLGVFFLLTAVPQLYFLVGYWRAFPHDLPSRRARRFWWISAVAHGAVATVLGTTADGHPGLWLAAGWAAFVAVLSGVMVREPVYSPPRRL